MTKRLTILIGVILAITGSGVTNAEESTIKDKTTYTFSMAYNAAPGTNYDQFGQKFKQLVEQKSDNRVEIKIYPHGSFGAEREMIESLLNGSLDITVSSDAPVVNFSKEIGALSFPFLFENEEVASQVLDGEVGAELSKSLESVNLRNLHWLETGFYQIYSKEPVNSLADLKGMKIRSQESEVQIDFLKALGTNPTPINFGELYQSVQQGVIDGFTSAYGTAVPNKLHEVVDYVTEINLFYVSALALMNNELFEGLPSDVQKILLESAKVAANYERKYVRDTDQDFREQVEKEGVTIIKDVDLAPFREAVKPVYEKYEDRYGDVHRQILE